MEKGSAVVSILSGLQIGTPLRIAWDDHYNMSGWVRISDALNSDGFICETLGRFLGIDSCGYVVLATSLAADAIVDGGAVPDGSVNVAKILPLAIRNVEVMSVASRLFSIDDHNNGWCEGHQGGVQE